MEVKQESKLRMPNFSCIFGLSNSEGFSRFSPVSHYANIFFRKNTCSFECTHEKITSWLTKFEKLLKKSGNLDPA